MSSSGMIDLPCYASPYLAGQTIDTQLTTNCNAKTQATFDINDSTYVTFYFQNNVPLWQALLSVASQRVTLIQPINACGIILSEGLNVSLTPMGAVYTVWLNGVIVDTGTSYKFEGFFLGSFTRDAAMKRATQLIRLGRSGTSSALQSKEAY